MTRPLIRFGQGNSFASRSEIAMADDDLKPITGAQIRAGRALVRWSADELARRSGLETAAIRRAEARDGSAAMPSASVRAIRAALDRAGVQFIAENGGGAGVRLRRRLGPPDEGLRPDQLTSENDD
jgi:hypothetical protein